MKILFVDDEPRILAGIENALIFAADHWEADFSTSGEDAIRAMKATAYHILVTDMKMPGLTG
ncbi:MAG: YesN/AraC family two-component response regulator, partial [Acidimicrobiales bacterium]